MAPGSSTPTNINNDENPLFIDLMLGGPLQMYVDKDVPNRDHIADLIVKHGGQVSSGYSGVPYILVDPYTPSGQSLYRQWITKKKIILSYRWGECKVTGKEQLPTSDSDSESPSSPTEGHSVRLEDPHLQNIFRRQQQQLEEEQRRVQQTQHDQQQQMPLMGYPYHLYGAPIPRSIDISQVQQTWQPMNGIDAWNGYVQQPQPENHHAQPAVMIAPTPSYDYRYRDDTTSDWGTNASVSIPVSVPNEYFQTQSYEQVYAPGFLHEPVQSVQQQQHAEHVQQESAAGPSTLPSQAATVEQPRGRKRHRARPVPAAPASSLVLNRNNLPTRSPSPPTKIVKSTYGGNLFTDEDIEYLKKYIDYCQNQGLVLSLREICERIAVKAPHHTFYSWRRYCNKHQIRLGGYAMALDPAVSSSNDTMNPHQFSNQSEEQLVADVLTDPRLLDGQFDIHRQRSPTPPRALFRSTTGKGVAFTEEDINFLVRLLNYRKVQGIPDMVAFWKDVAARAPHHSRASWMKFWRRHKHELERSGIDDPLPDPPEKKIRYSHDDDVLLAEYFFSKPAGTAEHVFQTFGRLYPHHPWKGWQEHYRIHKAKIDHLVLQLGKGETLQTAAELEEEALGG